MLDRVREDAKLVMAIIAMIALFIVICTFLFFFAYGPLMLFVWFAAKIVKSVLGM